MKAKIEIQMDNAAFDDGEGGTYELARILRRLAADLSRMMPPPSLRDMNGNAVGTFAITDD